MPPLEHVEHEVVQAMKKTGMDPALIYAFEKPGLMVTQQNENLIPEKDLEEWQAAIDEFKGRVGWSRRPYLPGLALSSPKQGRESQPPQHSQQPSKLF